MTKSGNKLTVPLAGRQDNGDVYIYTLYRRFTYMWEYIMRPEVGISARRILPVLESVI
jgi:hypothetical protein